MIWREFKAMGSDIIITASLEAEKQAILIEAEREILNFEKRFSRFISDNELAEFNNSPNIKLTVSSMMAELLRATKHYYLKTKGIFDPTIINNLEAVGYNKSFDKINPEDKNKAASKLDLEKLRVAFLKRPKMSTLQINGQIVERPRGLRIDLGGIGKGYIVDLLSQEKFSTVENYWISAGGDIFVSGSFDKKTGWDIGVQNPYQPAANIFFLNTKGEKLGIATSGIIKRAGQNQGFTWHHIIDPRNGLPVINDILSVTVISSSATRADIFAKTVLILGTKNGLDFIEKETDSACIIFNKDKQTIFSSRARAYLK